MLECELQANRDFFLEGRLLTAVLLAPGTMLAHNMPLVQIW